MKKFIIVGLVLLFSSAGYANYSYRDGNGNLQTIYTFICGNSPAGLTPPWLCPAQVLMDSSGNEKGILSNPVRTDPTGTTTQPVSVVSAVAPTPYGWTPVPPMQSGVPTSSVVALTIPSTATYAVVCASGAAVNYSTDGQTTPSNLIGMPLNPGGCVPLFGPSVLAAFKAVQQFRPAVLNISYFK